MKLGSKTKKHGFTLIEFMAVVLVLAILVVLFFPAWRSRMRPGAPRINCMNNLKMVGLSFRMWALDNNDKFPMQVSVTNGGTMELAGRGDVYPHFLVMSNELNTPKVLFCQADRNRKAATVFTQGFANSNISYFVGLGAVDASPQLLLSGDDCLMVDGRPVNPGVSMLPTNAAAAWTKSRHNRQGNIGLADGSVMGVDTPGLRLALTSTGMATNRLVMP